MGSEVKPGDNVDRGARSIGLPPRPFLYTLDQIATLLDIPLPRVQQNYIFYDGRSIGPVPKDLIMARNIAPEDKRPDWRVADRELIRWMRRKGFRFYDRASIRG